MGEWDAERDAAVAAEEGLSQPLLRTIHAQHEHGHGRGGQVQDHLGRGREALGRGRERRSSHLGRGSIGETGGGGGGS